MYLDNKALLLHLMISPDIILKVKFERFYFLGEIFFVASGRYFLQIV
jgi:hypothetical protein